LYKRQFGTHRRSVVWGWAGTRSLASISRWAQYALRRQIERAPNRWIASLPGRAMRRFDVYRGLIAPSARTRKDQATRPKPIMHETSAARDQASDLA
jgi:hypothetical protein